MQPKYNKRSGWGFAVQKRSDSDDIVVSSGGEEHPTIKPFFALLSPATRTQELKE
jgi:hypothetical protein